jgi:hypothetical protein
VIGGILSRIRDPHSRALLLSNVFSHLQGVESRFFENENCVRAIAVAMSKIEHLQDTPTNEQTASADMPKEIARKFLRSKFVSYLWLKAEGCSNGKVRLLRLLPIRRIQNTSGQKLSAIHP